MERVVGHDRVEAFGSHVVDETGNNVVDRQGCIEQFPANRALFVRGEDLGLPRDGDTDIARLLLDHRVGVADAPPASVRFVVDGRVNTQGGARAFDTGTERADAVVEGFVVSDDRNVVERWLLGEHGTGRSLGPIVEGTSGPVEEPGDRRG